MTEKNVSRRGFLSIAVTAVVVGVVAGVGGYYVGLMGAAPGGTSTATTTVPGVVSKTTVTVPSTFTQTVYSTVTNTATATSTTTTTPVEKPDKLTLMTWGGPASDNVPKAMTAFTAETGIKMNMQLQSTSVNGLAIIRGDWPRVNVDVFSTIPSAAVMAKNENFIVPIDETLVPNMKDIPDNMKIKVDGKTYAVPSWFSNTLCMWNKEKFPKGLKAVANLLDPALKGRITCGPITDYTGGFVVQLAYARGGSEKNMEPGWQFMKELAQGGYIRALSRSDAERTDMLLRGEAWASWTTAQNLLKMQTAGAPIEANKIYSDSKTALDPVVWCITDGPRKEWAMRYLNSFLEPKMLQSITNPPGMGTVAANVKCNVDESVTKYILTPQEANTYGYFIDPFYQAATFSQWSERWEKDILPLLG